MKRETVVKELKPTCTDSEHPKVRRLPAAAELEGAARIFRAMGDAARLRILVLLQGGDLCVTEIVTALDEKLTTMSQRLKLLRTEGLVSRRREGTHIYYGLADTHVLEMIRNATAHAKELTGHSHPKDD